MIYILLIRKSIIFLNKNILKRSTFYIKKRFKITIRIINSKQHDMSRKYTCYYAVYIKEIERYNTLPEKSGTYHMYILSYVFETHQLRIKEYTYQYKI